MERSTVWESAVPASAGLHYRNTDERNEQRGWMSTSSPSCFLKLEMESAAISTLMSDLQDKVYFLHYHCLNGRFLLFSLNYFIPFKVSTQQIRLFFWHSLSSCVCPDLKPVNVLFSKRTASVAAVSLLSLGDCFVGSISGVAAAVLQSEQPSYSCWTHIYCPSKMFVMSGT